MSNVAEFVAYAKANPGKINFGSPGQATLFHIVGEMLNVEAGTQMTNVPYKGSAPALQDLVAGQIQVQFDPGTLPLIADGRLKGLAVVGDRRWPRKPDMPTLSEQGYAKTGGDFWHGIVANRGTPQPVVDALSKAIEKALKSPDVIEKLANVQHFGSFLATGRLSREDRPGAQDLRRGNPESQHQGVTALGVEPPCVLAYKRPMISRRLLSSRSVPRPVRWRARRPAIPSSPPGCAACAPRRSSAGVDQGTLDSALGTRRADAAGDGARAQPARIQDDASTSTSSSSSRPSGWRAAACC